MKTIVIADTDPHIRAMFKELFNMHVVYIACNGLAAINLVVDNSNVDLVIIEADLPIVSGMMAYKSIRLRRPELFIVLMVNKTICIEDKFLYIIPKPIKEEVFYFLLQTFCKGFD